MSIVAQDGEVIKRRRNQVQAPMVLTVLEHPNENQLFKFMKCNEDDTWEMRFIVSCSQILSKFMLEVQKTQKYSEKESRRLELFLEQMSLALKCITDISLFVTNKIMLVNQDQQYGYINHERQNMIHDQQLIDVIIKILEDILTKSELNYWQNDSMVQQKQRQQRIFDLIFQKDAFDESPTSRAMESSGPNSQLFDIQAIYIQQKKRQQKLRDGVFKMNLIEFIESKVAFCRQVYKLLVNICKDNAQNQQQVFELIPFFQIHAKYIIEAIYCITDICKSNEQLLLSLSDNLLIPYNYHNPPGQPEEAEEASQPEEESRPDQRNEIALPIQRRRPSDLDSDEGGQKPLLQIKINLFDSEQPNAQSRYLSPPSRHICLSPHASRPCCSFRSLFRQAQLGRICMCLWLLSNAHCAGVCRTQQEAAGRVPGLRRPDCEADQSDGVLHESDER